MATTSSSSAAERATRDDCARCADIRDCSAKLRKALILELDVAKAAAMIKPLLDAPSGSISIRDKLKEFADKEGLPL